MKHRKPSNSVKSESWAEFFDPKNYDRPVTRKQLLLSMNRIVESIRAEVATVLVEAKLHQAEERESAVQVIGSMPPELLD